MLGMLGSFSRIVIGKSNATCLTGVRHATKKAGGSTKNGRDSAGRRLGVKKFGGELVSAGNILIRQRGATVHAGDQTKMGKDFTIFALQPGYVEFKLDKRTRKNTISVSSTPPANVPLPRQWVEAQAAQQ